VDAVQLSCLFDIRGTYLSAAGRYREVAAYDREATRLAEEADDNTALGRALTNLADDLASADPAAAAHAARTAPLTGWTKRAPIRGHGRSPAGEVREDALRTRWVGGVRHPVTEVR
jgi:hypothetical protein